MEQHDISQDDIRAYCLQRLPESSPTYTILNEEFLRDPENSRVGRYCREAERIARLSDSIELDWQKALASSFRDESRELSDERGHEPDGKEHSFE